MAGLANFNPIPNHFIDEYRRWLVVRLVLKDWNDE